MLVPRRPLSFLVLYRSKRESQTPFCLKYRTRSFIINLENVNSLTMSLGRTFKLNSGHAIPAIGLGTWVGILLPLRLAAGGVHDAASAL